ncbi:MAG TPA: nuclear transport factor 2 family protein [Bacteroidales bacterium]|jgi:hypothetical protein|nr:nuclear transport factor 2 family protein [Bacteroidales bacterium]
MKPSILFFLFFSFFASPINSQSGDSLVFVSLVEKYVCSIEEGDTSMASSIWAHTPEVTFIRPSGTEYGWNGVKKVVLVFRDYFTQKNLNWFDLRTSVYNDFAWLQFFWEFDAIMKSADSSGQEKLTPVKTKGRETQVWRRINEQWRLVHVHYSGMPENQ